MTILCYHTVDPTWDSDLSMTPERFAAHCRWLGRNRDVIPLGLAARMAETSGSLPRRMVAITFDDGLAGIHEHALRPMITNGLTATIFVVARTLIEERLATWIDDAPPGGLAPLTRDQLLELRASGFTIGSHTLTHPDLTRLSDRECDVELRESKEILEDCFEEEIDLLAYPRGLHRESVRRAAARAGYRHAFGTSRLPHAGRWGIPRVGVYRRNGVPTLRTKSSRLFKAIRLSAPYLRVRHPLQRHGTPG